MSPGRGGRFSGVAPVGALENELGRKALRLGGCVLVMGVMAQAEAVGGK